MKSAEESITWKDGHYEIALTFRDRLVPVPNNRVEAEEHAVRLKRKLQKNPKLLDDYRVFTEDIVEKVSARKAKEPDHQDKTWFIPTKFAWFFTVLQSDKENDLTICC